MVPLVRADRPAPGVEALARTSIESGSVVFWLMEDGLTARKRVCRMQLLRRNSAKELGASIAAVGANPSVAGNETISAIEAECHDLGLAPFGKNGDELEGEVRLRYTSRVNEFIDDVGYTGAYNIYSGVAHAELAGLWRLFRHTASNVKDQSPIYTSAADPQATFSAVDGALKAMMLGCMEPIALLFDWTAPGRAEEFGTTIEHINSELARLHP